MNRTHARVRSGGKTSTKPAYDPEAEAYFASAGVNAEPYITAINTLVLNLKAAELWHKLDRLWLLANENAEAARVCLRTHSVMTAVNNPVFTIGRGYAGNGSDSYINTNFAVGSDNVTFVQNSASLGIYNRTNSPSGRDIGGIGIGGSVDYALWAKNNIDNTSAFGVLSTLTGATSATNTNAAGMYVISRTAAANQVLYKNGVALASSSATSSPLAPVTLYLLAGNYQDTGPTQFCSHELSLVFIGGGLEPSEVIGLFASIDQVKVSIGF